MKTQCLSLRAAAALLALAALALSAFAAAPARGLLFSAFLFDRTPLAERWAVLRPEAERLFPALKLKAIADLHVTVVYIGGEWDAEKLAGLRQAVTLPLREAVALVPEVAFFGRGNRVVAIELQGFPDEFRERVIGIKKSLSQAGVKRPEPYDDTFRPHVTLAEAPDSPPTGEQARQLDAFRLWINERLDLTTLQVTLDPGMPIRWLLADAPRSAPFPEYVPVETHVNGE